jgi:hypothetical protein
MLYVNVVNPHARHTYTMRAEELQAPPAA